MAEQQEGRQDMTGNHMTPSRREMMAGMATAGLAAGLPLAGSGAALAAAPPGKGWEWGPMRWVQICATEDDPARYDKQFWIDDAWYAENGSKALELWNAWKLKKG